MKVYATYFQNSAQAPLVYGQTALVDPPRRRLRGEREKTGVLARPVIVGFCGTDHTLMQMGAHGALGAKFPKGQTRLINGHEGVVWVPDQNRFAVVLIRGGDCYDPTRYGEDETYFEYGCDGADGLFADAGYFHPDMLLPLPQGIGENGCLPLEIAKRLVFCDPFACMLFQLERIEDLGGAHNFRIWMAREGLDEQAARKKAVQAVFEKTVIFGLGTTGLFLGDLIRRKYPGAQILYVGMDEPDSEKVQWMHEITGGAYVQNRWDADAPLARQILEQLGGRATLFVGASGSAQEHRVAFEGRVLGCNGVYDGFSLGPQVTFDTMPFGFENHLIFSSINFRQCHMQQAILMLCQSRYDRLVTLMDKKTLIEDPMGAYEQRIYCKGAPLKTAVLWDETRIGG